MEVRIRLLWESNDNLMEHLIFLIFMEAWKATMEAEAVRDEALQNVDPPPFPSLPPFGTLYEAMNCMKFMNTFHEASPSWLQLCSRIICYGPA